MTRLYFNNSPPGSLSDFTVSLWLTKRTVKRVILLITAENWLPAITKGYFRVPKTLTFKMRLGAQPFLWKWVSFAWEGKMISISKAEHLSSFWNRGSEVAREFGSRWLSKCIVGLFWRTYFQYGGKFVPQKSPTMHFDNHFDPVSRATLKSRINHTCLIAVRNPWGLKKPVIQNTLGLPSKHQFLNWLFLSKSSVYQNPSVEDSHEI